MIIRCSELIPKYTVKEILEKDKFKVIKQNMEKNGKNETWIMQALKYYLIVTYCKNPN